MSGNNTLATLRADVRDYLNEVNAGFWTDAQVNKYINKAYHKYFNRWMRLQPQWGKRFVDVTYGQSTTLLDGAVNTTDTTWTVDDSSVFSVPCDLFVDSEIVRATAAPTDTTLTVVRAQYGTTAASHVDDSTVTDSNEYKDITISEGHAWRLDGFIEDRTLNQPGSKIRLASRREQMIYSPDLTADSITTGTPLLAWVEYSSSVASGVFNTTFRLYLAPRPTSSRNLRLHLQLAAENMSGDTYTTGLPAVVEECVVLDAVIRARGIQEEAPGSFLTNVRAMLQEAERDMKAFARPIQRGPSRVVFRKGSIT